MNREEEKKIDRLAAAKLEADSTRDSGLPVPSRINAARTRIAGILGCGSMTGTPESQ
jgi:hypothetical protein